MNSKIAFVVNNQSFFTSHLLQVALAAKKKGFEIKLFCGVDESIMGVNSKKILKKNNIKFQIFNFYSASLNIYSEFLSLVNLYYSIKKFNPDIIHCGTHKGVLYGGLISLLTPAKGAIYFISGMGFLFSNTLNKREIIFKQIYLFLKKIIFLKKNKRIVIENKDDINYYQKNFNLGNQIVHIKGSGVDLKKFKPHKIKKKKIVVLPSRVLLEKGITEFILAVDLLVKEFRDWKFLVVGSLDYLKKSSYQKKFLDKINKKKNVEFIGYKKDIKKYYDKATIVCLPSYREGLSKTLSEASACGIPVVTSNVTGCKDAILNKKTGLLCKPKSYMSLKHKLSILMKSKYLRKKFGKEAVNFAKKNFDIKFVVKKNLKIYDDLLKKKNV